MEMEKQMDLFGHVEQLTYQGRTKVYSPLKKPKERRKTELTEVEDIDVYPYPFAQSPARQQRLMPGKY